MAQYSPPPPNPPGIDPNVTRGTSPSNQGSSGVNQLIDQIQQDEQIGEALATGPVRGGVFGVLGGQPVAEKSQEYFAVIKEVGDTSPEIIDKSQFKVIYLCDSQLNVSKPAKDSVALSNINQNFERQGVATVRVDQGTALNPQLAGNHTIHAVGSVEPILGTQIGRGPLSYVTTMSFVQEGQLGADPGRTVEEYYIWMDKSLGFQNVTLAKENQGTQVFRYAPGTFNDWGPQEEFETPTEVSFDQSANSEFTCGQENPFRLYHDTQQYPVTGAAVQQGTDTATTPNPGSVPTGFDSSKYFNKIEILTGSLEGNSRIRASVVLGIMVRSSSVSDIWASRFANWGTGAGWGPGPDARYAKVNLKIYKESNTGTKIQIGKSARVTLDLRNPKVTSNLIDSNRMSTWTDGSQPFNAFDFWTPDNGKYINLRTDYFSVNQGDKIYAEIELPAENSASAQVYTDAFTQSLKVYADEATFRTYEYFAGSIIITQETPPGQEFVNDITGVTASYYTTNGSASVYNYSASYWVGYNNFSSSDKGIGSYITSSTALSNFYGGQFIQANPGSEEYNVINAEVSPSSSLGVGTAKKTWTKFGFNPIRLPFTILPGDIIRFEYSPTKVYEIKQIISGQNVLKLKLNKQLDPSTVFDNFVIYRIVQDGQYIILDVKKNIEAGIDQPFTGIITPEYASENLRGNADNLIFRLKQANIIEE